MSRSELAVYDTEPRRYYPEEGGGDATVAERIDWLVDLNFADALYSPDEQLFLHRLDAVHRQAGSGARQQTYYGVVRGAGGLVEALSSELRMLFDEQPRWEPPDRVGPTDIPPAELIRMQETVVETPDAKLRDLRALLRQGTEPLSVTVPDRQSGHRLLNYLEQTGATILMGADLSPPDTGGPVSVDLYIEYGEVTELTLPSATEQALDAFRRTRSEQRVESATTQGEETVTHFASNDHYELGLRIQVLSAVQDATNRGVSPARVTDDEHVRQAGAQLLDHIEELAAELEDESERQELYDAVATAAAAELTQLRDRALDDASDTVQSTINDQIRRIAPAFSSRQIARQAVLDAAVPEYRPGTAVLRGHRIPWPYSLRDIILGLVVGLLIGGGIAALVSLGVLPPEPITAPR